MRLCSRTITLVCRWMPAHGRVECIEEGVMRAQERATLYGILSLPAASSPNLMHIWQSMVSP